MEYFFNTRHGDYVLASRVAMGGMGEVFLALDAKDDGLERFVVLKCLHTHLQDEPKVVEMFYREARLGSLFRHKNLVRVDDVSVIEGRHTMVMAFAPGITLRQLLDRLEERHEAIPTGFVLDVLRQLATALGYAHNLRRADGRPLGIVHRDLSPDNVLIGFDGIVRLLDFGVAAASTNSNEAGLAGKVAYMSPEQCRGETVDARADLYALGTLFWEMLQGRAPYTRFDRIVALRAITDSELPAPASSSGRELAAELDGIWQRLHAKLPTDRFADAQALLRVLDDLNEQHHVLPTENIGLWSQRLFPHESAELRTICEKLLRAPAPTENTLDLDKESFSLELDDSPTVFRSAGASRKESAPRSGEPTDESSAVQLSATEFTSVRQIQQWRLQRNLLLIGAAILIVALAAVLLLRKEEPVAPAEVPVTFVVRGFPTSAVLRTDDTVLAEETPAIIAAKSGDFFSLELASPGYLPAEKSFWVHPELATTGIDIRLEADRNSPVAPIGEIRVNYGPGDAVLSMNGAVVAEQSPADVQHIALNTPHTLRLERVGYQTLFLDVRLSSEAPLEFDLQMVEGVPLARLSVTSTPAGATVLVDGQEVGTTPLENLELPANTAYTVQLNTNGYRVWRKGVMLQRDDHVVSAQLERESPSTRTGPKPVRGLSSVPAAGATPPPAPPIELPYRMLE